MEYTQINNIKTSRLGFGCMRFPLREGSDTAIDEDKALEMIDLAIKSGVTYFDTAYPYHGGKSEEFTGRALAAYPRESVTIATKLPVWKATDLEGCKSIFEEQLKNLRTDHFDFYLIHALNKDRFRFVKENGVYECLLEEKKRGRIRSLGFSFHDNCSVLEENCLRT
jgi:Predicted oxidoreductases of the aldo/keto reductase family